MKKILSFLFLAAFSFLHAQEKCSSTFDFSMEGDAKVGPYTHLKLNNDPCKFQFAIVTDRTGGHRPGVFMDGVYKLNLLQPEFVMSVGDLIEGYTEDTVELNHQWNEFEGFVSQLQMPFFYLPGNHDITNQVMEDIWHKRFGKTFYHFTYKDVLFLCLNSEDMLRGAGRGTISDEQFEYAQKVLRNNADARWTLIFMHQPLWHQLDTRRWEELEKILADRNHTVFAGHEHRYVKDSRNNGNYFTLATTGGASGLRGPELGEFDHVMWVTMTDRGPVLANLELDGIWDEDIITTETKNLIEKMEAQSPIKIEPLVVTESAEGNGSFQMKISNDENIPMKVKLKGENSANLGLFTETNEIVVPPNSVEFVELTLQTLNEEVAHPAVLRADVSLQAEGEPALITYPYSFNLMPLPRLKLDRTKKAKLIDAQLDDWSSLRYQFSRNEGEVEVSFDLCYDDDFLYMVAKVKDDDVVSLGTGAAWVQDNITFGLNAEKSSSSSMSVGRDWFKYEFLQLVTPEYKGVPSVIYREMPEGSQVKCIRTEDGYQAEIAIPISYIVEKQGEEWQSIRVNIGLDDKDQGEKVERYNWQPSWRSNVNIVGSGLFWREK